MASVVPVLRRYHAALASALLVAALCGCRDATTTATPAETAAQTAAQTPAQTPAETPPPRPAHSLWLSDQKPHVEYVIAADDTVYGIGGTDAPAGMVIFAFAADTGDVRWRVVLQDGPGASYAMPVTAPVAPAIGTSVLLVGDECGDRWALERASGRVLWSVGPYVTALPGAPDATNWPQSGPPQASALYPRQEPAGAISGDTVFICDERFSTFEAREATSGKVLWRRTPPSDFTGRLAVTPTVVVAPQTAGIIGLYKRSDGTPVKTLSVGGRRWRQVSTSADGSVVSAGDGVAAVDPAASRVLWQVPITTPSHYYYWPAVERPAGDVLVAGGPKTLSCLAGRTGKVRWTASAPPREGHGPGDGDVKEVVASDRFCAVAFVGERVAVYAMDGRRVAAWDDLESRLVSGPSIALLGDRLYVADTHRGLLCLAIGH